MSTVSNDEHGSTGMKRAVQAQYGETAKRAGTLAQDQTGRVAAEFGYSADDLGVIPQDANLGLSCGNPVEFAQLKAGEVVVDLGAGGGMDVFLAAARVGPGGCAIGIDMTPDMVALAQCNAAAAGVENVRFVLSEIEAMPLDDSSVDCAISNCVVNLCQDKLAVFREIFRILKPGGRVAISDIVLRRALPDDLRDNVAAFVGCIAGAVPADDYLSAMAAAGFDDIRVQNKGVDLNIYTQIDDQVGCCGPAAASCCGPAADASDASAPSALDSLKDVIKDYDLNEYAASAVVMGVKPGR